MLARARLSSPSWPTTRRARQPDEHSPSHHGGWGRSSAPACLPLHLSALLRQPATAGRGAHLLWLARAQALGSQDGGSVTVDEVVASFPGSTLECELPGC